MARFGPTVESPGCRLAALVFLVGILFGLLIWFGSLPPAPEAGEYYGSEQLAGDYDRYLGERVVVSGPVLSIDPVVIDAVRGPVTYPLTISGVETPVSHGEHLSVFGIVREGRTIEAVNAYTIPQHGFWYAYVTSFLAGLWVLGRVMTQWRFTREPPGLTPRETQLDVRTIVREFWTRFTGETDA